jgi:Na+-driven multidrug efflux pump
MAVWLCGPVLSLIDTSAVGVFSGTVQQAALSPAVSIVDYTSLCLAFMFTGTTNLIAGKDTTPESSGSLSPAARVMKSSLQISLRVGVLAMVFMMLTSSRLLKLLIGNDGVNPGVYIAALKYVRIRALGMPADVIMRSAQAACLGLKDIMSPLLVLLVAATVNGLSDALLVPCKYALFNGAAGAAWATVFSQYTAVFLYLIWLRKGGNEEDDAGGEGIAKNTGLGKNIRSIVRKAFRRERRSSAVESTTPPPSSSAAAAVVAEAAETTVSHATLAQPMTKKKFTTRGMLKGKLRKRGEM